MTNKNSVCFVYVRQIFLWLWIKNSCYYDYHDFIFLKIEKYRTIYLMAKKLALLNWIVRQIYTSNRFILNNWVYIYLAVGFFSFKLKSLAEIGKFVE